MFFAFRKARMFGDTFLRLCQVQEDYFSLVLISVIILLVTLYEWSRHRRYNLPPGPYGLPIVGYLPFLSTEPHLDFNRLCKQYGNIIGLSLGSKFVVILGEFNIVKEAFSKRALLNRPPDFFDVIPYGVGIGNINGREWKEQRRYCIHVLKDIGLGNIIFETNLQLEVEEMVETIQVSRGKPFHFEGILASSVSNNVASLLFGYRLPLKDPNRKFLNHYIETIDKQAVQIQTRYFLPQWINTIVKFILSYFSKEAAVINNYTKYILNEIEKQKFKLNEELKSFITLYLQVMESNAGNYLKETFTLDNLRGNINGFLVAGSDPLYSGVMWLILAMAAHPEIQDKVQEEIDKVLGKDGRFSWSMRFSLPYTYATVLECQRWRTIAYLDAFRMASEDIRVGNFDIPKGTIIIANFWSLHNDTNYWINPEEFDPERFLTQKREVVLKPDSYLPWSYGKRSYPAVNIAPMILLHYFIGIMQNFLVQTPKGKTPILKGIPFLGLTPVKQQLCFLPRK